MTSLRYLQTLTAGAALFALLGACGLAPARSAPRPIVRPHPPRGDLTIRSLTGMWVGVRQTPDATETLTLSLVQSGDALTGSLTRDGQTFTSDPARPARLEPSGQFVLEFGRAHEIVVQGRTEATGNRISTSIKSLATQPIVVVFRRR
jgi:hypothetical protein